MLVYRSDIGEVKKEKAEEIKLLTELRRMLIETSHLTNGIIITPFSSRYRLHPNFPPDFLRRQSIAYTDSVVGFSATSTNLEEGPVMNEKMFFWSGCVKNSSLPWFFFSEWAVSLKRNLVLEIDIPFSFYGWVTSEFQLHYFIVTLELIARWSCVDLKHTFLAYLISQKPPYIPTDQNPLEYTSQTSCCVNGRWLFQFIAFFRLIESRLRNGVPLDYTSQMKSLRKSVYFQWSFIFCRHIA